MTRLTEALLALDLHGEIALSGRWAKLDGERCAVYVAQAPWDAGYYTWCDDPDERVVKFYPTASEAIEEGLSRAAQAGRVRRIAGGS